MRESTLVALLNVIPANAGIHSCGIVECHSRECGNPLLWHCWWLDLAPTPAPLLLKKEVADKTDKSYFGNHKNPSGDIESEYLPDP